MARINMKQIATVISENKDTIKRKAIVGVGTAVGMLIASAVIEALEPKPEVLFVEVPMEIASDSTIIPSE